MQLNLLFLEDYLRADEEDLAEKAICSVVSWVAEHPGITLQDLLATGTSSDVVFAMIAQGELYVDLRAALSC